jgi:3-methyl-2-oxobutanoate hydroxymethyltransferase
MVQLGYDGTEKVTMSEMLHHCKSVSRTSKNAFLIGDMPFGSYLTIENSLKNACRFIKESGMHAVKLEGGKRVVDKISAIVNAGILVQGHIGLTPQTANALGGYKVQGRTVDGAIALYEDALALQNAGCFSIVLECVPEKVAMEITNALDIPTIGIGAGRHTSGQVQVFHDVTGLYDRLKPKFAKRYTNAADIMSEALNSYREETEMGKFPSDEHVFKIKKANFQEFREAVGISSYQELHYQLIQEQLVASELEKLNA